MHTQPLYCEPTHHWLETTLATTLEKHFIINTHASSRVAGDLCQSLAKRAILPVHMAIGSAAYECAMSRPANDNKVVYLHTTRPDGSLSQLFAAILAEHTTIEPD